MHEFPRLAFAKLRCSFIFGTSRVPRTTDFLFVQDVPDRAGAQTALHDAAEAIVDLRCRVQLDLGSYDDISDVVIADDVAGTNDHGLKVSLCSKSGESNNDAKACRG
jgi:hypothetical protein